MKLRQMGEDKMVAALSARLAAGTNVIIGSGDDCAVIGKKSDSSWLLLKTDCVVEGVHFHSGEKPRRIGWKALARALSDIAAMSGLPGHALVTLALSPEESFDRVRQIYAGLNKCAERFGVGIVGGETSRSPGPMFISVALTGVVEKSRCVLRSGGRIGDPLFVTGRLAGSIRGHHLDFLPRIHEARWLTEHFRIHAMMDLSDGLAADLPRLARASNCGFAIEEDALPLNRDCSVKQALQDGEDYELLFAISPRDATELQKKWRKKFPDVLLTRIGKLTQSSTPGLRSSTRGFDHFA
jgi:thiamine-monophosphate kinase